MNEMTIVVYIAVDFLHVMNQSK